MTTKTDFTRTAAAYKEFLAGEKARYDAMMAAETDEAVMACLANDKAAWDKVTDAFALDTAHVNSRDRAKLAGSDLIKKVTGL